MTVVNIKKTQQINHFTQIVRCIFTEIPLCIGNLYNSMLPSVTSKGQHDCANPAQVKHIVFHAIGVSLLASDNAHGPRSNDT